MRVLILLFCSQLMAAPIPSIKKPTREQLIGQWKYEYFHKGTSFFNGWINFHENNKFYFVYFHRHEYIQYYGYWTINEFNQLQLDYYDDNRHFKYSRVIDFIITDKVEGIESVGKQRLIPIKLINDDYGLKFDPFYVVLEPLSK